MSLITASISSKGGGNGIMGVADRGGSNDSAISGILSSIGDGAKFVEEPCFPGRV